MGRKGIDIADASAMYLQKALHSLRNRTWHQLLLLSSKTIMQALSPIQNFAFYQDGYSGMGAYCCILPYRLQNLKLLIIKSYKINMNEARCKGHSPPD